MKWLVYLLVLLLWSGCQPYPDHGDPIPDFRANSIDFGTDRSLKLVSWEGTDKELLLEFNQPIHRLEDADQPVPFQPVFRPLIPVKSITRTGISGVKIEFAKTLPAAHRYTVTVPVGWRALSGASFLKRTTVEWETARPELVKAEPVPGEASWQLTFNQPVDMESLYQVLDVPGLTEGDFQIEPLGPKRCILKVLTPVAVSSLKLKEGLVGEAGSLRGVEHEVKPAGDFGGFFICEESVWVPETGAVRLVFSEEVERQRILDNLRGVENASPELYTIDLKTYHLYLRDLSQVRHLTISDTLTARSGAHLIQDVTVTVSPPERPAHQEAYRAFNEVPATTTVLQTKSRSEANVATWRLSSAGAASLVRMSASEWSSSKRLPVELTRPLYSRQTKEARARTRFLPEQAPPGGSFLVRVSEGDKVRRFLVARSGLKLEGWSLNGVVTGYVGRRNGAPAADIPVALCDSEGRILERVVCGPDGLARFSEQEHRGVFLWTDGAPAGILVPVVHTQAPPPLAVPGMLWTQGRIFRPSQERDYLGVWWSADKLPLIELVDAAGELVPVELSPPVRVGSFFHGRFTVPELPGEYRLRFRTGTGSQQGALAGNAVFEVSRLAAEDGASEATLELAELEDGRYGGTYSWEGSGAALLGLRAKLETPLALVDGWQRKRPGMPDTVPLELEQQVSMSGGSFSVKDWSPLPGRRRLVVEMFDRESPRTVVQRASTELGAEKIELVGAALKPLSYATNLATFRFRYSAYEANGRRPLFCRLTRKAEVDWETAQAGEANFANGAYEWDVSFPSRGTYRIEVMESADGEPLAVWQRNLRDTGEQGTRLSFSPSVVSPGQRFSVGWPGTPEGTAVWLSLLGGGGQNTQRRYADQDGGLGEMTAPPVEPGRREIGVVLASLDPKVRMESDALAVHDESFYQVVEHELVAFEAEPVTVPEEKLKLRVPGSCSFGVLWWAREAPVASSAGGLNAVTSFVRDGQALGDLPFLGPLSFRQAPTLTLAAPSQAGEYALKLLGINEQGKIVISSQLIQVENISRFQAVAPDWLRPGDLFAAGVRYWSDPEELAPIGATTGVEDDSNLFPLGYRTTAALVDPGAVSDMLFSYRAPEFATGSRASEIHLVWDLGVEGESHRVEARLVPLASEADIEEFRDGVLEPGTPRRINIPLEGRWLVRVGNSGKEPANLSFVSAATGEKQINIAPGNEMEILGSGTEALALELLYGPPVRFQVLRIEPLKSDDRYTAARVYTMRQVEDSGGERVEAGGLNIGQDYLLAHYMVAPEPVAGGRLTVPLPGGTRPKGVWYRSDGELTALSWKVEEGTVECELPEMAVGEHEVIVLVAAHVGGEFAWPASRVVGEQDRTVSSTRSGRVSIRWE